MMRLARDSWRVWVVGALALATLAAMWPGTAQAQQASCGASQVVIEGGRPSPFALPGNAGERLEVAPTDVLTIRVVNPPEDASVRWSVAGLSGLSATRSIGTGTAVTVALEDYAQYGHGLYGLDVALLSGRSVACDTTFDLRITGFGGTAGAAAAGATGVAGAVSLVSAVYAAQGGQLKLKAKPQIQRRRRTGWRRWVPVPAWKRTIISTIVGAITGLCAAALLQQAGVTPLSLASAIRGLVTGGAVSLGVGVGLGVIWTYVRSPVEPEAATAGEDDVPPQG